MDRRQFLAGSLATTLALMTASRARAWRRQLPHVAIAVDYAESVVAGRIPACLQVRQACERQLNDLERADFPYYFDGAAAERVCDYLEMLPHIEGQWASRGELLHLQPWQCFSLTTVFGWKHGEDLDEGDSTMLRRGTRRFRTAYIAVPRKNGKLLALDTQVATPEGFKPIVDIHPGDIVFGVDGSQVRVTWESEISNEPCVEVEFSTGEKFVCHDGHLWTTEAHVDTPGKRTRVGCKPGESVIRRPRTAREIQKTLTFGVRGDLNHRTEVARPLQGCAVAELPVEPYVLGVWLGDGDSDSSNITNPDEEVVEAVRAIEGVLRKLKVKAGSCARYSVGALQRDGAVNTLRARLRGLGVLGNKHIPRQYLRASTEQRLALLRGLMDTDGTISKAGQCDYCTTRPGLADDFRELCASLGIKTTIRQRPGKLYGVEKKMAYYVQFWPEFPVFTIKRKLSRQRPLRNSRGRTRMIVAVRDVPTVPTKCIAVEGGEFLIGRTLVPTHNTFVAAGVGLYMLDADDEAGAQVYSVATTRNQARHVFSAARQMARRATSLDVRVHNIFKLDTASRFEPLHAQGETLDGYNIHCAINDELHAWKKRAVYDVIETAMGARAQPLMFDITTAGNNLEGVCYELHGYGERVLNGTLKDERFFAIMYGIDKEDMEHWQEPEVWRKANPNFGISVSPLDVEGLALKARELPSEQNAFLTKRLNVWVNTAVAWMNMVAWRRGFDPQLNIDDFKGSPCFAGIDLASKIDVNSLAILFAREINGVEHYFCFMRHWLPEEAITSDRFGLYDGWVRSGQMRKTPGNVIDIDMIEDETEKIAKAHSLVELGIDPGHNSTQYGVHMTQRGLVVVDVRPTVLNFSEPMKWLEAWVKDGRFHFNCEVLTWMVSNVIAKADNKDNIYPRKESSARKIDGVIALLIAINRLKSAPPQRHQMFFLG